MWVGDEIDYLPVSREGAVRRSVKTTAWLGSPPDGGTQRNHDTAPLTPTPLAPTIDSCRLACIPLWKRPPTFRQLRILSDSERRDVVNTVAHNPQAGVSLGGGIRKLRIRRGGRGKSSGARVVFLFAGESVPVFLLTVFAKNEKTDLRTRESAALAATARTIVTYYRGRRT